MKVILPFSAQSGPKAYFLGKEIFFLSWPFIFSMIAKILEKKGLVCFKKSTEINEETNVRLKKSVEIFFKIKNTTTEPVNFFISGGAGLNSQEKILELLKKEDVSEKNIKTEDQGSVQTSETIQQIVKIFPGTVHIIAVSSWYHLPRIGIIFRRLGIKNYSLFPVLGISHNWLDCLLYEYIFNVFTEPFKLLTTIFFPSSLKRYGKKEKEMRRNKIN